MSKTKSTKDKKWYSGRPLNHHTIVAEKVFDAYFSDGISNIEGDSNAGVEPGWDPALIVDHEVKSDINHAFTHLDRHQKR